jgi:predicted MFS family arabinose efflux permease
MHELIPVRNKTTWVSYFQTSGNAWYLYSLGGALVFLREDLGISRSTASINSIVMAAGSIGIGLTTSAIIRRIGRGYFLRIGSLIFSIGVLLFSLSINLPMMFAGGFFAAFGGSMMVQGTSAFLNLEHGRAAPVALAELNAIAAGIGLVAPLAISAGVTIGIGWRPGLATLAIAMFAVEVWRGKDTSAYGPIPKSSIESHHHDAPGKLPKKFWWAWAVLVVVVGCEFSLVMWAADLFRDRAGLSASAATAASSLLIVGMFIGRLIGMRVARRIDPETLIRFVFALSFIGVLIFWLASNAALMFVGLALTGLGMSMHWPLGITRAIRASGNRPDVASARVTIGAGTAGGVAPFALAALADALGIWAAYAIVPTLFAFALIVLHYQRIPADHIAD